MYLVVNCLLCVFVCCVLTSWFLWLHDVAYAIVCVVLLVLFNGVQSSLSVMFVGCCYVLYVCVGCRCVYLLLLCNTVRCCVPIVLLKCLLACIRLRLNGLHVR